MASFTTVQNGPADACQLRPDTATARSPDTARSGSRFAFARVSPEPTWKFRTISFSVGHRWLLAAAPRMTMRGDNLQEPVTLPTVAPSRPAPSRGASRHSRRTPAPTEIALVSDHPP